MIRFHTASANESGCTNLKLLLIAVAQAGNADGTTPAAAGESIAHWRASTSAPNSIIGVSTPPRYELGDLDANRRRLHAEVLGENLERRLRRTGTGRPWAVTYDADVVLMIQPSAGAPDASSPAPPATVPKS